MIVGLFLVLQAFFLFLLLPAMVTLDFVQRPEAHMVMFFPSDGGMIIPRLKIDDLTGLQMAFVFPDSEISIPGQVVTGLLYWFLCIPTLLIGIFFLRIWRYAWSMALALQIILLSLALIIYFIYRQPYVYLVMLYSIFLVFYLNHYEVQQAFKSPSAPIS